MLIALNPRWGLAPRRKLGSSGEHTLIPARLDDADDIALIHQEGRDVHALPVDEEVTVENELARLGASPREAQAKDDVIEPTLERLDERVTRDGLALIGLIEIASELLLDHPVDTTKLLLLTETDAIFGRL